MEGFQDIVQALLVFFVSLNVKPDPEGFLLAMKQYGAAPKDTVIFEDSDVGIEAAYATGASVFRVMMFYGEQEKLYERQKENIKAG